MLQLRLIVALASFAGVLLLCLYVQHLRSANASLGASLAASQANATALRFKVLTDASVQAADNARAEKAEVSLKSFQERADAERAKLKNPSRMCFDRDDTRRVQRLFER